VPALEQGTWWPAPGSAFGRAGPAPTDCADGFAEDGRCDRLWVHRPGLPGKNEAESRSLVAQLLDNTGTNVGVGCHRREMTW